MTGQVPQRVMPFDLAKLMRRHKVTIRELAKRMDIAMKRVRQVRDEKRCSYGSARDFIQAVTGIDPGPVYADPLEGVNVANANRRTNRTERANVQQAWLLRHVSDHPGCSPFHVAPHQRCFHTLEKQGLIVFREDSIKDGPGWHLTDAGKAKLASS